MSGADAATTSAPDPTALLKAVRQSATLQKNKDLKGRIRKRGLKIPFSISLRGELMCFQYKPSDTWERFDLKFREKGQEILSQQNGKMLSLPTSQYVTPIAGTDVTYEDLSMRFLYWQNGTILPEDSSSVVKGRSCWVIQLKNPNPKVGQYAWVRVWIDKENGAMWQIDGIDGRGELSKRFMLTSVMKLKDGNWFFKQMKIEVRDPANSRNTTAVDYIEMDSPE